MNAIAQFEQELTGKEKALYRRLNTPFKVQSFLETISYCSGNTFRTALDVIRMKEGCCFEGALFAACMLRKEGYPPLLMNMHAVRDDDHTIYIYRTGGCWGAIAKSNFAGLRFREPVYRTLRELVLSYFDCYFNLKGEKTLRSFSSPLRLTPFDSLNWMISNQYLHMIDKKLDSIPQHIVVGAPMVKLLSPVDKRMFAAGTLGTDKKQIKPHY